METTTKTNNNNKIEFLRIALRNNGNVLFCFYFASISILLQMSGDSVMVLRSSIDRKILCKITIYDKTAENMERFKFLGATV